MPRHKISGGGQQQEQPREGSWGQVPAFPPAPGGFLRLREEEGFAKLTLRPPGRARPREPPTHRVPTVLLRWAPRALPYLPPPSVEPITVPPGAGRAAPKKSVEEIFYLFIYPHPPHPRKRRNAPPQPATLPLRFILATPRVLN